MNCVVDVYTYYMRGRDTLFILSHRPEAIPPSWFWGVTGMVSELTVYSEVYSPMKRIFTNYKSTGLITLCA